MRIRVVLIFIFFMLALPLLTVCGQIKLSTAGGWGILVLRNNQIDYYRYTGQLYACQADFIYPLISPIYVRANLTTKHAQLLPLLSHPEFYNFNLLKFRMLGISTGVFLEPYVLHQFAFAVYLAVEAQQIRFSKKFNSKFYDYDVETQLQYWVYCLYLGGKCEYVFGENAVGLNVQLSPATLIRQNYENWAYHWSSVYVFNLFYRYKRGRWNYGVFLENRVSTLPFRSVIRQIGANVLWEL